MNHVKFDDELKHTLLLDLVLIKKNYDLVNLVNKVHNFSGIKTNLKLINIFSFCSKSNRFGTDKS